VSRRQCVYCLNLISRFEGQHSDEAAYYLTDRLGSTTGLTNASGGVTATYQYDVFGAVRTHTGASTEWSFTGEQNDPTGLEYLRARYHEPALGRLQLSVAREKGDAKESTISWGTALAEPVSELTKCSASLSRAADSPS